LAGLNAFWESILIAQQRFVSASLAPGLGPLSAVACLWLFGTGWGIFALACGTLAGLLLEMIVLGSILRARGIRLKPRWQEIDENTREIGRRYAFISAVVSVAAAVAIIDQAMAAGLGPGSVAALNYGGKVVGSVSALVPMAIGTAVTPWFALFAVHGYSKMLNRIFKASLVFGLMTGVTFALGIILFSEPLVRVLFQRGAFTAQDTGIVAGIQSLCAMQIPFLTLGTLGTRMLTAKLRLRMVGAISILCTVLKIIFNYALMSFMGVDGIALATAIVAAVGMGLTFAGVNAIGKDDGDRRM